MGLLSSALSAKDLAQLSHSLGTLYEGGVSLPRAFKAIEESGGASALKNIARDLRQAIEQGATLGQAIHWNQKRFPPLFIHVIQIAEQSGSLGVALSQLSKYYEDLLGLYRGVIQQVTYPLAVILAMVVGIPILTAFLSDVAGIADAPFEVQLYWIVRDFGLKVGGMFLIVVVAARVTFRYTTRESILMYAWPLSGIVRRILISRFAWAMMVFTRSGMPLDHAIRQSGLATGARRIAQDFERMAPLLRQGHSLEEALRTSKYLPKSAMVYISTGEITGKLDECFEHLSRGLYDEALFRLRVLVGIIEPLWILAIGGMIVGGLGLTMGAN